MGKARRIFKVAKYSNWRGFGNKNGVILQNIAPFLFGGLQRN
jgi:hypothetical protein